MASIQSIVDINLNNQQLLNVVLQNLAVHPSNPPEGRLYYNTAQDTAFVWTGTVWLDLGNIYVHPTYSALNPTLTGANVLASLETNNEGHVIAATTRLLTLADLGYTGDPDANNYTHPTFTGNDLGTPLTGATVISDVTVNNQGHVTGFATRNITAADVGAAVINDSAINATNTWSSQKIQAELDSINNTISGGLVYKGSYNAATNTPDLDVAPVDVLQGYVYVVSADGTFYSEDVQTGDMLFAETDNPASLADWTVINKNIPDIVDATTVDKGIIRIATQSEVFAGTSPDTAVTPATLVAFYNAQETASGHAATIGDGVAVSFDITHNLNTRDVIVQLFDTASYDTVLGRVERNTINTVRVLSNVVLGNGEIRVLITEVK